MNEIFREQYRETQARELARLKADRAGQVVPPRSSPPRAQSGTLPGTTSAVPVTAQTQLPPITSLLGAGATDTVTQGDGVTQSTKVTETVDTTTAVQTETPADQTETPAVQTVIPVTETPTPVDQLINATVPEQMPPLTVEPESQATPPVQEPEAATPTPPVVQETEPVTQQRPVEQPAGNENTTPASTPTTSNVASSSRTQTLTPVVTRSRKRGVSITSAPGDVGPGEESPASSGEIYHKGHHFMVGVIWGGLQIKTRENGLPNESDPVQPGWQATETGCSAPSNGRRPGWTRRRASSSWHTSTPQSTLTGVNRSKASGHVGASSTCERALLQLIGTVVSCLGFG